MEPEKRIKINDKILPKMLGNDEAKKDAHMKNWYRYLHLVNNLKYKNEQLNILNEKRKEAKGTIKEAEKKWEEDEKKKNLTLLKKQKEEARRLEKEKEKFKKFKIKKRQKMGKKLMLNEEKNCF